MVNFFLGAAERVWKSAAAMTDLEDSSFQRFLLLLSGYT